MTVREQATLAKDASLLLATTSDTARKNALLYAAEFIERNETEILAANALDVHRAEAENTALPMIKRLRMDSVKLADLRAGLCALAQMPDPLHKTQLSTELADGLELYRVTCPIGVIGVIFESRPDALVQISSLCIRSGNAVLLKGGREARETCAALFALMNKAALAAGLPKGWGALLESREEVSQLLAMDDCVNLIIPRGSNAFVRYIMDNSRIPVLGHADGICHVYVDASADIAMACRLVVDSKAQYVSVCNAAETLLVHADIASQALPRIAEALRDAGVTIRGCEQTRAIIECDAASARDWDTEYLDYIISIKIVDSLTDAVAHINRHGSGHTDAIIAQDETAARSFMASVDSAGVYWNCSTRFADGFRYGFGAEVGVSTGKIHARGPMGIEGLCTYKYKLIGHGQTVGGGVAYTHRPLGRDCPLEDERL